MSIAADALQPFTVPGLFSLRGRTAEMGLADIINRKKVGFYLDFDASDGGMSIDFRDPQHIVRAMAADSSRMATASFQTVAPAIDDLRNQETLAWGLVKLYYAAFYAGHSLIRIFGEACSYFSRKHIDQINAVISASGQSPPFQIESGLYHCVVTSSAACIRCTKAKGSVGGSHEALWKIFGHRIQEISEGIAHGDLAYSEAQAVILKLERLSEILCGRGTRGTRGYDWLSMVRNEIQYQHQHGVWFPIQIEKSDRHSLSRLAKLWGHDPMAIDLPEKERRTEVLPVFVVTCAFIVSLCRTMLTRIADRSDVGAKSFVHYGAMAFLNNAQLAK